MQADLVVEVRPHQSAAQPASLAQTPRADLLYIYKVADLVLRRRTCLANYDDPAADTEARQRLRSASSMFL